jgi:drug/metabolite transporter (DMT)-like permease
MNWFVGSIIGMLLLSVMFLAFKKIGQMGTSSYTIIIFEFLVGSLLLILFVSLSGINFIPSDSTVWALLILVGILGAAGNVFLTNGINAAPNPGYALAIVNANIILVTIASFFLFHSEITPIKGLAVVLISVGIIILGL